MSLRIISILYAIKIVNLNEFSAETLSNTFQLVDEWKQVAEYKTNILDTSFIHLLSTTNKLCYFKYLSTSILSIKYYTCMEYKMRTINYK